MSPARRLGEIMALTSTLGPPDHDPAPVRSVRQPVLLAEHDGTLIVHEYDTRGRRARTQ